MQAGFDPPGVDLVAPAGGVFSCAFQCGYVGLEIPDVQLRQAALARAREIAEAAHLQVLFGDLEAVVRPADHVQTLDGLL